jgi:hypothetical protein
MFSQRKNCRIHEWLELNGWNSDLIGRNSDLLDGIPWDWTESCQSVDAKKKSPWTDLDKVSFKKFVK